MRGQVRQRPKGQRYSTLTRRAMCALVFIVVGGTTVWAQGPAAVPASSMAQEPVAVPASSVLAPAAETGARQVRLLVGRSTVLDVGREISRVSLTSADIADALVTSPRQLLINGKLPGTISMFVWDRGNALLRYEVVVQRDLAQLAEQIRTLFPGERIDVQSNGRNVVLSGLVTSKDVVEKAASVAAGYVDSRDEVVTLMQLRPDAPSNQVLLRVRFAEVSRNGLTELGASIAANGYDNGRWFGRSTTGQFPAPEWDNEGRFVFSDFLNLFLFDAENQVAGVIRALQNKGLFQSLAEPNLVAESGKEASFLAGGEFPIPVAQGSGSNIGISIVFKEFGIRLKFTPTVNGNRVHLKVEPEVSTIDFNNAIVLDGFRIPALSTRRISTELEVENGQTFAIAGLINNQVRSTFSRIPGIGHIPILGLLFQSKAAQKDQTELVVMITPEILPNNSRGVSPDLPRLEEPFLEQKPMQDTYDVPPPAFSAAGQGSAPMAVPVATPASTPNAPGVAGSLSPASTPTAPMVAGSPAPAAADASGASAESLVQPVTAPVPPRALSDDEKKAVEQARREEEKRAKDATEAARRAQAEAMRREAQERRVQEKLAKEERERQEQIAKDEQELKERLAKEQAKRDEEEAKRSREQAQRLAEAERDRQDAIAEAEEKLKAAEDAYQAELARQANP